MHQFFGASLPLILDFSFCENEGWLKIFTYQIINVNDKIVPTQGKFPYPYIQLIDEHFTIFIDRCLSYRHFPKVGLTFRKLR